MQNNKSLAMLFSLMPGAGHMYIGLQRKGIQIMASFFLIIGLSDWLRISFTMFLLPIIWFFSIFDVRKQLMSDKPIAEDEGINFVCKGDEVKFVGYGLIIIGILSMINRVVFPALNIYLDMRFENYIRTSIASILCIGIGIKLLTGKKTKKNGGDKSCANGQQDLLP